MAKKRTMKRKLFSLCVGLTLFSLLMLAGCDNGSTDDDDSGGEPFSISGSFTKTGTGDDGTVKFDLKSNTGLSRAAEDSYTLSGVLEDGDLTMRLKGSFDPNTGKWSVSAKSTLIIYTIDGSVDSAGISRGSSATIAVKKDNEWVPFFFPVTEAGVSIPDAETAVESEESGMPSFAKGTWYANANYGGGYSTSMSCIISDWKIIVSGTNTSPDGTQPLNQDMTLLEYTGSGSNYDVIYCYPEYVETGADMAKALAAYLGIAENDITAYTELPTQFPSGRWIWVDSTGTGSAFGNFSEAEFAKLRVFWATGGWETWAATHSVTPQNRYEKIKISYIASNTKFEAIRMVGPATGENQPWNYTNSYSTLAALKAAESSLVEEYNWSWNGGDTPTKGVVKVMTFSR
jgi:hypothetical protein